ncbi:MAG: histidine phosphatase family protein [Ruminococcaceae bacterium]|nr:histidine phosphatase family protein [Oscillospiraceae bacterium]
MTRFILIRHGESEANRNNIFAGHLNADLQNKGVRQAELTAKYIVDNYKVDRVYASDLIRAFKTGKCVADLLGIEVIPNKGLREIEAGVWDGLRFDELPYKYPKEFDIWINDIGNSYCPGGERVAQVAERFIGTLRDIASENDGKTVVIATHATPIRTLQTFIEYGDLAKMQIVPWVSNASVTVVEYEDGQWKCTLLSYDEHLGELRTVLPARI